MRVWMSLTLPAFAMACTTTIEENVSADYAPVYPTEEVHQAQFYPTGSIYNDRAQGLFAMDRRASKVGDILTVELEESFTASKNQSSSGSKQNDYEMSLPSILPATLVDELFDGGTSQSFAGNGAASQSNSLSGRMSVSVVRVFPGGNLEIIGQKKLTLNNGDEYIRLRGIVRPADISSDNVISSERIANADIKYIGAGQIADTSRPGWMRQVTQAISPY